MLPSVGCGAGSCSPELTCCRRCSRQLPALLLTGTGNAPDGCRRCYRWERAMLPTVPALLPTGTGEAKLRRRLSPATGAHGRSTLMRCVTGDRVDKYFEVEMTVQDCDLDKYGVVNNAIYASYIEKAREELLVSLGISQGWVISTGNAMALSELNLKYFTPLRRGEKFLVKVRLARIKGVRIFAEHLIEKLPERKLVLDATATIVCLNKDYRPTRVFPEMSFKLHRFFSS